MTGTTTTELFSVVVWGIFIYFILMHGVYFCLIILGFIEQRRYHEGIQVGDFRRIEESDLSLPVSVIISAFNEEKMIVSTVLSVMQLKYPEFEVIVVNDGSVDSTLTTLVERFDMYPIDMIYKKTLEIKPVCDNIISVNLSMRVAVVGPAGPTTSSRTGSTGPT